MVPPEEPHHPPANPCMLDTAPLTTAGNPSTHRTLRSASGRKPERANSLLDEFATEELRTLSKLLPSSAAAAIAHRQPEDERSASPGSPPSTSTVGSQPTGSEHLSPNSAPRTHSRAGSRRPSSKSTFMLPATFVHTLDSTFDSTVQGSMCMWKPCLKFCPVCVSSVCNDDRHVV